jgi:DNA-binding transcriptional regulator YiaG
MTPEELESARKQLGWSQRRMAAELEVDTSTIFRWIHGERGVPGPAAVALRTRIALESCQEKLLEGQQPSA